MKKFKSTKRSFVEAASSFPGLDESLLNERTCEDWFMEDPVPEPNVISDDYRDGIPMVNLPKNIQLDLCRSWNKALIIKFMGNNLALSLFQQRILRVRNLKGKTEMVDIRVGFYIVKFELRTDYMHVLMGGPWKLFDHYFVVQRWKPNFDLTTEKLTKMAVWVRLPSLPVEYFWDGVLKIIL